MRTQFDLLSQLWFVKSDHELVLEFKFIQGLLALHWLVGLFIILH